MGVTVRGNQTEGIERGRGGPSKRLHFLYANVNVCINGPMAGYLMENGVCGPRGAM